MSIDPRATPDYQHRSEERDSTRFVPPGNARSSERKGRGGMRDYKHLPLTGAENRGALDPYESSSLGLFSAVSQGLGFFSLSRRMLS